MWQFAEGGWLTCSVFRVDMWFNSTIGMINIPGFPLFEVFFVGNCT
jgi:hypothetical protein